MIIYLFSPMQASDSDRCTETFLWTCGVLYPLVIGKTGNDRFSPFITSLLNPNRRWTALCNDPQQRMKHKQDISVVHNVCFDSPEIFRSHDRKLQQADVKVSYHPFCLWCCVLLSALMVRNAVWRTIGLKAPNVTVVQELEFLSSWVYEKVLESWKILEKGSLRVY